MNLKQWLKSVLSLNRSEDAAQREEYGLPDEGLRMLETDRIVHPGTPPAQTGEEVLREFERPPDGTP